MAVKHGNALAGSQVPDPDLIVHWRGEQLQPGDVGVELNNTEQREERDRHTHTEQARTIQQR